MYFQNCIYACVNLSPSVCFKSLSNQTKSLLVGQENTTITDSNNDVARTLKKLRTLKGVYLIKQ